MVIFHIRIPLELRLPSTGEIKGLNHLVSLGEILNQKFDLPTYIFEKKYETPFTLHIAYQRISEELIYQFLFRNTVIIYDIMGFCSTLCTINNDVWLTKSNLIFRKSIEVSELGMQLQNVTQKIQAFAQNSGVFINKSFCLQKIYYKIWLQSSRR